MNERRPRKSAPTAAEPPSSDGSATPSSPSVTSEPNLPPIAADADDLDAIKKAVDDAASVGGGLWLSYLFVLFYLAVAAGAVTHADLFFENPVKLPFLTGIELPLVAFFFLAPILFVIVHAYTLVHLVMLTEKAKRYHQALHDPERNVTDAARENLQWQLPSNIFIQFLAGPPKLRESAFGRLLRTISWITLVVAPLLLLLMMQTQFLPFHSLFVVWTQRIALGLDLALIWWLWREILSGREIDKGRRRAARLWPTLGLVLSVAALLFCVAVVTFPGERQEELPSWRILPAMDEWGSREAAETGLRTASFRDWVVNARRVSLHDWLFNEKPDSISRRRLPFSNTLVLTGLNVYEGLGVDDPDKVKARDYVFRARGRDLRGAIFDFANMPKVDFEGANLRGSSLVEALLQGARLDDADLRGAQLDFAQLQGASLGSSPKSGGTIRGARLQGATLLWAQLQGASLESAELQGAFLNFTNLQAVSLGGGALEGASLNGALLQAASLEGAQLQGAGLDFAELQGASFDDAVLEATDLSGAYLWRAGGEAAHVADLKLTRDPDQWSPIWVSDFSTTLPLKDTEQPWNDEAYQSLRIRIEALPPNEGRNKGLDRLKRLDCQSSDKTLASCEPPWAWVPPLKPPPEAAAWRKALEKGAARVSDTEYRVALAKVLKDLICSGGDDAIYVVRGAAFNSGFQRRLTAAGPEAPALIDFIMSKNCPVSASLTDADKANLLRIKECDPWVAFANSGLCVPGGRTSSSK